MRLNFSFNLLLLACTTLSSASALHVNNSHVIRTLSSDRSPSPALTSAAPADSFSGEPDRTLFMGEQWYQTATSKMIGVGLLTVVIAVIVWFHLRYKNYEKQNLKEAIEIETERLKKANEMLEQQKKEIENNSEQLKSQNEMISELSSLKTRYFANISHEFRTLITLIKSPIEKLIGESNIPRKNQKDLEIIRRNAGRLIELVNQLLDLSKLDRGKMGIQLIQANVFDFAHTIAISFTSLAEVKGISYRFDIPSMDALDWIDHDKIEKIINNLLSNAFKFTNEGGRVHLCVNRKNVSNGSPVYLEVTVEDTGPGIPDEEKTKIFDRFYQAENSLSGGCGGTGLGLAVSHELATLLKGSLEVSSHQGNGSTFLLRIPLGKDHFEKDEYSLAVEEYTCSAEDNSKDIHLLSFQDGWEEEQDLPEGETDRPLILVVEDHPEIRGMITDYLCDEYHVMEAVDGSAGLILAREHLPDLVVTDLVMPRLDGMELCYKLKTEVLTSHIPVVILTAKSSIEFRLRGYQAGADDYILKPFNVEELEVRIRSLIDQRRALREKFSSHVAVGPSEIMITSLDKKFLERAIQVVEKHMSDENFNVTLLSSELHMSRSTLFRKLEALTNQSPVEFIRTIRLKRAASLLLQRYGNISEVALQVGFRNPSYFAQQFRKAYSKTPKEFASSTG